MEKEQQDMYEYARKRIKQKKNLYYHFVLFLIGSLFMFVANILLDYGKPKIWYVWVCTSWFFLFILHFIKVYITDRFMNKQWEREQIDRLIKKQQTRLQQFQNKIDKDSNL